jgi:hypothetical protein
LKIQLQNRHFDNGHFANLRAFDLTIFGRSRFTEGRTGWIASSARTNRAIPNKQPVPIMLNMHVLIFLDLLSPILKSFEENTIARHTLFSFHLVLVTQGEKIEG